jgi:chromosome segregation ATPase
MAPRPRRGRDAETSSERAAAELREARARLRALESSRSKLEAQLAEVRAEAEALRLRIERRLGAAGVRRAARVQSTEAAHVVGFVRHLERVLAAADGALGRVRDELERWKLRQRRAQERVARLTQAASSFSRGRRVS